MQGSPSHDEATGEWAGIDFFASEVALAGLVDSDLRRSIAAAYELTAAPRLEKFRTVGVLR